VFENARFLVSKTIFDEDCNWKSRVDFSVNMENTEFRRHYYDEKRIKGTT
jgi:hypothetical protein